MGERERERFDGQGNGMSFEEYRDKRARGVKDRYWRSFF
jgi:hypothetical protein